MNMLPKSQIPQIKKQIIAQIKSKNSKKNKCKHLKTLVN